MTMLLHVQPEIRKFQEYLEKSGIRTIVPSKKLDFETDYIDSVFLGTKDGIANVGTLRLKNSPIDYVQLVKKQECVRCDYVMGSHVGMGIHKHTWWKIRLFLTFPTEIHLGPLNLGTIATIKKGFFRSEVENVIWNGYQKLTTLPPGLIRDNVVEVLDHNQELLALMRKCLLKEKIITISRYSAKETKEVKTNAKIVISSQWKILKDINLDANTLSMYEIIAQIVKEKVDELKYHLTYK